MSAIYFYLLLLVLTADGLMVFLTPVVVYMLTGSIEYSGLSYAIWWLPRIVLIPLVGKLIDDIGVKPLSIILDTVKIIGCSFLMLYDSSDPLVISISFGIVGSLVSIGNSQSMIVYEKLIAMLSDKKEHHANLISRVDFVGMIVGTSIGMLFIDYGYKFLLLVPCVFYICNACFFIFMKINHPPHDDLDVSMPTITNYKSDRCSAMRFVFLTPVILVVIGLALGNNMFDGVVESSGTALIDRNMNLPIKYFGLIDVAAGLCGVLGTYIYSLLLRKTSRFTLLVFGLSIIVVPSVMLIMNSHSIVVFILCYSITIVGKAISGNINRMIRIEVIPIEILASTSSIIVLLCQSILPIVGVCLFFSTGKENTIFYMLSLSVLITTTSGILLLKQLRKRNSNISITEKEVAK